MANRKAEIKAEIHALREELKQIEAAESAVGGQSSPVKERVRQTTKLTIQDMILSVLAKSPAGKDANEIIALIHDGWGINVARPSLSPQLSRLKHDGKIELNNSIWSLTAPNRSSVEKEGFFN